MVTVSTVMRWIIRVQVQKILVGYEYPLTGGRSAVSKCSILVPRPLLVIVA